jgi:hypothetical protein
VAHSPPELSWVTNLVINVPVIRRNLGRATAITTEAHSTMHLDHHMVLAMVMVFEHQLQAQFQTQRLLTRK